MITGLIIGFIAGFATAGFIGFCVLKFIASLRMPF